MHRRNVAASLEELTGRAPTTSSVAPPADASVSMAPDATLDAMARDQHGGSEVALPPAPAAKESFAPANTTPIEQTTGEVAPVTVAVPKALALVGSDAEVTSEPGAHMTAQEPAAPTSATGAAEEIEEMIHPSELVDAVLVSLLTCRCLPQNLVYAHVFTVIIS